MKSGTPNLLKFKRLQRQLGTSKSSTVGHLELLWLEACANCPEGDVGRFSNEEIAIMVDWAGDPDLLVESAVNSGWLDSCEVHRLLIHDWHEHCPNFVKGFMAKHGRQFARQSTRQSTRQPAKQPTRQDAKQGALHAATKPNLAKPIPNQTNKDAFDDFWNIYPARNGRKVGKQKAKEQWRKTPQVDHQQVIEATKNYAGESNGFPKDAERFLRDKIWLDFAGEKRSRVASAETLRDWTPE